MSKHYSRPALALFFASLAAFAGSAHAEILKGERIVGHYDCGTMICNFETPDAGTFDFEVADDAVAPKIFEACQIGDICAVTGDFDIENATIVKVTLVENSGEQYQD